MYIIFFLQIDKIMNNMLKQINTLSIMSKHKLSIILLIFGVFGVSFNGLIMRSISSADPWQILFYRSLSFSITISIILFFKYKLKFINIIKKTGIYGILGGILYMFGIFFLIHAFANTKIGNVLFIFSTIPLITAIFSYIFFNETISLKKIVIISSAVFGVSIMLIDSLYGGDYLGIILAILGAICASFYFLILRKSKNIDSLPICLMGGVFTLVVSFIIKNGDININFEDILLCIFWGGILNGAVHVIFTFTTKYLHVSEVTLFLLLETCLGPVWVWMYFDERISNNSLIGGLIILLSISVYCLLEIKNTKKQI